jgi:predicted  nucleic acid-binding Zn-ribbon protein
MVDMGVLLELQELDLELDKYRQERKTLPAELEELEAEFNQAGSELDAREAELKQLKVGIREAEGKTAQLDEAQNKYKQHLLAVKTNREYSALLTEIEAVKKEKEELEDGIIQKMSQVEAAEAAIAAGKEKSGEIKGRLSARRRELDGKLKALDGEIGVRQQKREALIVRVPANIIKLYDRIMHSRMSRAIVAVRHGSCSGCFAHIPLQKVADIRKNTGIMTCDHCGRMLYYDESEGNQS